MPVVRGDGAAHQGEGVVEAHGVEVVADSVADLVVDVVVDLAVDAEHQGVHRAVGAALAVDGAASSRGTWVLLRQYLVRG